MWSLLLVQEYHLFPSKSFLDWKTEKLGSYVECAFPSPDNTWAHHALEGIALMI